MQRPSGLRIVRLQLHHRLLCCLREKDDMKAETHSVQDAACLQKISAEDQERPARKV